ncbi:hypothetical protein BBI15_10140 [Planococcus plakortidis]|uniref:Uncharacterized protein n=1 Tax=Planococcus plakortidis TaxID=1038856 RepID=A0A1C7E9J4_9BACL|nr:hypothetical protein [Planococcus plakortidis]ANU20550.1 hypothetical protein BBI15_10140 [Planococcus plakortidis]
MEIPIEVVSDEKGYFDRECPHEECEFVFKIYILDWKNKVSDEKVYCPRCGHTAPSDSWWTQGQLDSMRDIARQWAINEVQKTIHESFKKISRNSNKYVNIKYKPGKRISFQNNPIGQLEEWELIITCEQCETKTSVIGTAYFCPCCGHNSVDRVFNESIGRIENQLNSLDEMQGILQEIYNKDTSTNMVQNIIETSLKEIISAFQKFAFESFKKNCKKTVRPNDFQIVYKGSNLFRDYYEVSYEEWLTNEEIDFLNLMFQRRHLLEHNNGMVDDMYLNKSNDTTYRVGQRLVSKKEYVIKLLKVIKKLSEGIHKTTNLNLN